MTDRRFSPEAVRNLVIGGLTQPAVFKGYLNDLHDTVAWQCLEWTCSQWSTMFGEKELKVRLGKRRNDLPGPQWENSCLTHNLKFHELLDWSKNCSKCKTTSGTVILSNSYWAYYDYVYLKEECFPESFREQILWKSFGFEKRGSDDSSIWIGTRGAHTPCHQDSFGCNLVAQVMGHKRWTLFPPQENLYATRIPYEESSIYSKVDFTNIDVGKFPKLHCTSPYVVQLEPGDVLFVPKHWWHFVESLDTSISINTWLELPSDRLDQLQEAVVQHQVAAVCQAVESPGLLTTLLNPNMLHVATLSPQEVIASLKTRIIEMKNHMHEEFSVKNAKIDNPSHSEGNTKFEMNLPAHNVYEIVPMSFSEYLNVKSNDVVTSVSNVDPAIINKKEVKRNVASNSSKFKVCESLRSAPDCSSSLRDQPIDEDEELLSALIQSFTDPRVIEVITSVMLEKL